MNIEEKVKMNLLIRGFDNKTQLNNRGLIGATIDETILEVVKNLRIADVSGRSEQLHLCPVCNEMAGKSYLLSKLPTICQKCDHAWNRA
jgi:hypothetical protein